MGTTARIFDSPLRGETLNYKMVAMDDFKPAYLGIHWCPEFSFWAMFLLLEIAFTFGSHDHIW